MVSRGHLLQWLSDILKNRFVFPQETVQSPDIPIRKKSRAFVFKREVEVQALLFRMQSVKHLLHFCNLIDKLKIQKGVGGCFSPMPV